MKYLGFPLPELEIIVQRDAEFLEDIWYYKPLLIIIIIDYTKLIYNIK